MKVAVRCPRNGTLRSEDLSIKDQEVVDADTDNVNEVGMTSSAGDAEENLTRSDQSA